MRYKTGGASAAEKAEIARLDSLKKDDRVSMVVYASATGVVLDSVAGNDRKTIERNSTQSCYIQGHCYSFQKSVEKTIRKF